MDRTQDRLEIAHGVGERLINAERALDDSFVALAALAAGLPVARQEGGWALQVGAGAATSFASALALIGQAREMAAKGHKQLGREARTLGLFIEIGGGDKGSQASAAALSSPEVADDEPLTRTTTCFSS